MGLLHFHQGISPFDVTEFPFLQYVKKDKFFCITEKYWYIHTKCDDKESIMPFLHKNPVFFYP